MQGDPEIINLLNEQLTSELTAINQYFLHAKMQENWGFTKLASYTRAESIDEMRHAERLTDRILFLEGLPNYQRLGTLHIGQTVPEQLRADLDIELSVVERLRPGIALMREKGDITSARIFEEILEDEERHIDYLETELELIERLGEPLYLQRYAEPREPGDD
jgi:bacterioferritin